MIISTSHTLEYKPNDIIITSSLVMCYYIIQNIIETIRHLVPRLLLQRFGRWSLGTNHDPGTSAPAHGMPSRLPPRDCVSRSYHVMAPAGPSVRSNVRLSVARCDRPESREGRSIWKSSYVAQDAYGLQRADIVRVLPVAFVDLRSHA